MQINSLSSLVTSAYDTARSNLRSMADAAAESGQARAVKPALAEAPQPQPKPEPAAANEAPAPFPGQRQGVSLDAYA